MDSGARAESGCGRDGRLCAAVLVNGSAATVLSTWLRPGVDVLASFAPKPCNFFAAVTTGHVGLSWGTGRGRVVNAKDAILLVLICTCSDHA
jgi:hypothetical protein